MSIDKKFENPQGRLIDVAKKVDLSTVQHARDIQKDRLNDESLRNMWFWTADFPLYTMEKRKGRFSMNGQAVLYLADREQNLAFQHLDDAVEQLRSKDNYFPNDGDIGSVINAESTLRIKISDLKLQKHNEEWSYFEIDTKDYSKLNKSQRALAEKVHGKGRAFDKTMNMLAGAGKTTTRIYTLNPEYVKKTLEANGSKSLARVFALNDFDDDSVALADDRFVDYEGRRLRGVPLGAEGATQKVDEYDTALKLLTGNPSEALKRMQPVYATELHSLVGTYLKKLAKA